MRYTRFQNSIYLYYIELNRIGKLVQEVTNPQYRVSDEVHKFHINVYLNTIKLGRSVHDVHKV